MRTDTNLLSKALIRLGILVFLFIASPILITMAFKALNKYTEAPELYFAYILILIGVLLILFTVYFAFTTFKLLRKSIFNN